jgi:hypothetical protein
MSESTRVAIISTNERAEGVKLSIELLGMESAATGKTVLVKPNFNTADTDQPITIPLRRYYLILMTCRLPQYTWATEAAR